MPGSADFARLGVSHPAVGTLSLTILWLAAAYLILLGIAVLCRPAHARRFLSAFAQSTKANLVESGVRFLVGLAFIGVAAHTKNPSFSFGLGLFLAATAILLAALPVLHRRFANRTIPILFGWFPLFGVTSLLLAAGLLWFIA